MNRLIIVAGASGAGKSFLLEQINRRDPNVIPLKKLSTREERLYEKGNKSFVDLYFNVNKGTIKECDYHYKYGEEYYGLNKQDIWYELDRGNTPVVIIRKPRVIQELLKDFPNSLIIYIQTILSGDDLKNKLVKLGRKDINIQQRMDRLENDYMEYCSTTSIYDYVILNKFDKFSLLNQFDSIIAIESKKTTNLKNVCFISGTNYKKKYQVINSALRGINPQYSLIYFNEFDNEIRISSSVEKRILTSDLIIIDTEKQNGPLYYYLGLSKALNKNFIVLHNKTENFDMPSYDVDIQSYRTDSDFASLVTERLEDYLGLRKSFTSIFTPTVIHLMDETIKEASLSTFEDDKPRPYVGAILVDEKNNIIAKSHRGGNNGSGEHAEYRLLEKVKNQSVDLNETTLFVTLEPCTERNHPKVPCAEMILKSGIKNIYVGMLDPDIRIRGMGIQRLSMSEIKVNFFPHHIADSIRQLNEKWINFKIQENTE